MFTPILVGNQKKTYFIITLKTFIDRMMENSMGMWMLVSGIFPIFLIGTLIKAYLHRKRIQMLIGQIPEVKIESPARAPENDWVPSP